MFPAVGYFSAHWVPHSSRTRGLFAEQLLLPSPAMTEGPFYPDKLPLDTDNDLIIIKDSITPAVGIITHLTGRVLSMSGEPVKGCHGRDLAVRRQCRSTCTPATAARRPSSRTSTSKDSAGSRRVRRVNIGSGRSSRFVSGSTLAAHSRQGQAGRPRTVDHADLYSGIRRENLRDGVYGGVRDLVDRELVLADFTPVKDSKMGEYQARFDIILGRTPDERSFRS